MGGVNLEGKDNRCSPVCEFFQCGQRKLIDKRDTSNPSKMLCGWVGDPCEGSACAYANCLKGRLRLDGSCGLLERTIPKVTSISPRAAQHAEETKVDLFTVAKTKVLKKIKWHEIE
jgi:hypothetical protein